MKDEKNKQQQPKQPQQTQQGNTGQKHSPGQRSSGQSPSGQQSPGQHPMEQHPAGQDPSRMSHKDPRRSQTNQPMDVNEGDIENPDEQEQPGKKVNIDDDPDQTKKKVPNMNK